MSSNTETRTVVEQIVDNAEERELWIVGKEHERPPYFHAGKGGDTRLAEALRMCLDDKITPQSDGSYQVQGSGGRVYRVAESCSCPASQHAKSRWCKHAVAVAVYVEWHRRRRGSAPVELGTLRPGTLPLPEEDAATRRGEEDAATGGEADAATRRPDPDAVPASPCPRVPASPPPASPSHTLQEDRMPDDEYTPEPDDEDAPTAIVEPPAPIKIPREFTVQIKGRTHVLYTGLVIAARQDGLTSLSADWTYNDAELSLAHATATFADGRRYEESGDASPGNVNKGISLHFRRVALTRAKARCLRDALGISACSVEEMAEEHGKPPAPVLQPLTGQHLRQRIWARMRELAPDVHSREEAETLVKARTGLELHPDNYAAILDQLTQGEGR